MYTYICPGLLVHRAVQVPVDGRSCSGWLALPALCTLWVRADRRFGSEWMALPVHRAMRVQADGRSYSGLMALPAHRAVWVRVDTRSSSDRAPCYADSGGRTVWFGVVSSARTCHSPRTGPSILQNPHNMVRGQFRPPRVGPSVRLNHKAWSAGSAIRPELDRPSARTLTTQCARRMAHTVRFRADGTTGTARAPCLDG